MDLKVKHLMTFYEIIDNICPHKFGIHCTTDCNSEIYDCIYCWEKSLNLEKDKEKIIIRVED